DGWTPQSEPSSVNDGSQSQGGAMDVTLQRTKDSTATPEQYVQWLTQAKKILDASGRSENFRDYSAWIGQVLVSGEGGRKSLIAGFVRYRPGQFLQVLGFTRSPNDVAAEQVLAS